MISIFLLLILIFNAPYFPVLFTTLVVLSTILVVPFAILLALFTVLLVLFAILLVLFTALVVLLAILLVLFTAPLVVNNPDKKKAGKGSHKRNIAGNMVYGDNAQYLANTKINCLNDKKEIVKTTTTNAFGAFAFNNIETDNFTLKKADGDSKLKPNTKVTVTTKDGKDVQSSKTDDKGNFAFEFNETNNATLDVDYHDLEFDLKGKVAKQDKSVLANGNLNLVNEKGEIVATAKSDKDGNFQFVNLRANQDDLFKVSSPETKFITFEQLFLTDGNGNIIRALPITDGEFKLDAEPDKVVNDPWTKVMELKNSTKADSIKIVESIYYNTGEYKLLPEALMKLDKLAYIMQNDPKLAVELSSHTDSRGTAESNMKLSEQRSKTAVDYIVSKGITKDRVSGKGYGETKLINKCADGVECTEEEHAKNRRIEFKISRKK